MGPSVPHPASAGKFAVWFHRKDYLSYFFFVAAIQTEFKVLKHENIIYFSDPDCEGHRCEGNGGYEHPPYDGEESQDEDSCSEHSSSTSTSTNQKEGKYCDCCYCEFFGHGGVRHACLCKHIDLRLTSCWCFFAFVVVVVVFFQMIHLFLFSSSVPSLIATPFVLFTAPSCSYQSKLCRNEGEASLTSDKTQRGTAETRGTAAGDRKRWRGGGPQAGGGPVAVYQQCW